MKCRAIKIFFLTIIMAFLFIHNIDAKALDEIQNYTIKVEPRQDGTLDMKYHIDWKVLDSTTEGPLTWVKIGIPNKNIDNLKAITSNIKSIKLYNNNYVRIDFKNKYYAGQTVTFEYSFHQSYMYTINKQNNTCSFEFTPGWFNDIAVRNITVQWNKQNVTENNSDSTLGNYLKWSKRLNPGEKIKIKTTYNTNAFTLNVNKQRSNSSSTTSFEFDYANVIIVAILFIILFGIIIFVSSYNSYNHYRGFSMPYYHHHSSNFWGTYDSHDTSSSFNNDSFGGSSSCACACACACAGGGRAGCSKKDFYGTNIQTKDFIKRLKI